LQDLILTHIKMADSLQSIENALQSTVAAAFSNPASITPATIIDLSTQLIGLVSAVKTLTPSQQKDLVLSVLQKAVALPAFGTAVGAQLQTELTALITNVLPDTIEIAINAAAGKYNIAQDVQVVTACCCFGKSLLPTK
jgi:hypothetical protein